MTAPARRRWLYGAAAAAAVILFAGQWLAGFLAERWWAAALMPDAPGFLAGVRFLRLTIEAAAILLATAWYVGHLLVVHRAIGSVQVSRQVANLEIREAITPAALLPIAIGIGTAFGVGAGLGAGRQWTTFALAWQGVSYGATDPILGRDLGLYVAQLPLWLTLQRFGSLLAWSALAAAAVLYAVVGALRWNDGRPAISDHARRHLGLLLAVAALVLAWGLILRPFVLVADGPPTAAAGAGSYRMALLVGGAALAAAIASAIWGLRGTHLWLLAAWVIVLIGRLVLSLGEPGPRVEAQATRSERASADQLAFGLHLREVGAGPPASPVPTPVAPSLWSESVLSSMVALDSQRMEAAGRAAIPLGASSVPAWLVVRSQPGGAATVLGIADDHTALGGRPLSYRAGDSVAYPGLVTYANFALAASRPAAPRYLLAGDAPGPIAGGWPRRAVLAWSLQAGSLLGSVPTGTRVAWHLAPRARLSQLAPFARWSQPRPILLGEELSWVAYGYLSAERFPGSSRVEMPDGGVALLDAAFVGAVTARTGATAIYLAPGAGPLGAAWAAIAQGVVQPRADLPPKLAEQLGYPEALFEAQARILEAAPWSIGRLVGRTAPGLGDPLPPSEVWEGGGGYALVTAYEQGDVPQVDAVLTGRMRPDGPRLLLQKFAGGESPRSPSALRSTWERFPSYEQIRDSVTREGDRFERGAWRLLPLSGGPLAYSPWYAVGPGGAVTVPFVAMALGPRVGAGRGFPEAWENLRGAGAPLPPGIGPATPLEEARRWMGRLDAALRTGDWEAFGRAFGALRQVLGVEGPAP